MKNPIPIRTILFTACSLLAISGDAQGPGGTGSHPDPNGPSGPNGLVPLVLDSFFCTEFNLSSGSIQKQSSGRYVYQNNDQQLLFTQFDLDASGAVVGGRREQTFYDGQGHRVAEIRQILIAGEWYDFQKDTFIYTASGLLRETVRQNLSGGIFWTNSSRALYSFDPQGNLDTLIGQAWDLNGQNWVNGTLTDYDYTAAGLLLLQRNHVWKTGLNQWGLENEGKNIYHSDGRRQAYYFSYVFPDSIFRLAARDTFLYNDNNLNDTIIRIVWDEALAQYRSDNLVTYQYDQNGNQIFQENNRWENDQFRPVERAYITPGDNIYSMTPAEIVRQYYDDVNSVWKNSTRQKDSFTPLNDQVIKEHYSYEFADFNQADWNTSFECDYYYRLETVPVQTPQHNAISCAIPNPYFAGSKCRCGDGTESGDLTLRLFDLTGRLVFHQTPASASEFELPVLPAGMYVLAVVRSDQSYAVQKILFAGQ